MPFFETPFAQDVLYPHLFWINLGNKIVLSCGNTLTTLH